MTGRAEILSTPFASYPIVTPSVGPSFFIPQQEKRLKIPRAIKTTRPYEVGGLKTKKRETLTFCKLKLKV